MGNAYQGMGSDYETLLKAFDKDCANFMKRAGKDRTIRMYKVMLRYLQFKSLMALVV
jgi:hypothetical protein